MYLHPFEDDLDRYHVKLAVTALFTLTLILTVIGHSEAATVSAAATNLFWIWR